MSYDTDLEDFLAEVRAEDEATGAMIRELVAEIDAPVEAIIAEINAADEALDMEIKAMVEAVEATLFKAPV